MALRVALCFANSPAVARSNLGFQRLIQLFAHIGQRENIETEQRFAFGEKKKQRPLYQYDALFFSVPFEGDDVNLVKMLFANDLEPLAARRAWGPLIIAGGMAVTLNPEPLAEIIDIAAIGDAEVLLPDIIDRLFPLLRSGANLPQLLEAAQEIDGLYLPARYRFHFDDDGGISGIEDLWTHEAPAPIKRQWVEQLQRDAQPVISNEEIFGGAAVIEASRGCLWGCRFCAAGYVQRPYRERDLEQLWQASQAALALKPRVGLIGADIGDLGCLHPLVERIHQAGGNMTPSALRATAVDDKLARALAVSGKKTATIAAECGTDRLRDIINKQMHNDDILRAVDRLADAGIESLRMYFMIGFPMEQDADIDGIVELSLACRDRLIAGSRQHGRVGKVTLSVNPFIPKPGTPFQWEPFAALPELKRKVKRLRRAVQGQDNLEIKIESVQQAWEQSILARADRRLGPLMVETLRGKKGAAAALLRDALRRGPTLNTKPLQGFALDDILPWQLVEHGVGSAFLRRERQRALAHKTTPMCTLERCRACAIDCGGRKT